MDPRCGASQPTPTPLPCKATSDYNRHLNLPKGNYIEDVQAQASQHPSIREPREKNLGNNTKFSSTRRPMGTTLILPQSEMVLLYVGTQVTCGRAGGCGGCTHYNVVAVAVLS